MRATRMLLPSSLVEKSEFDTDNEEIRDQNRSR